MQRRSSCGSSWGRWGMSDFVPLKAHVKIAKGKPPAGIPYSGKGALPYLNPDYLRGNGEAVLAKSGSDSIVAAADDTVVLWDGSNAGEFFRAKPGIVASTMAQLTCDNTFDPSYFFHAAKHSEWFLKGQTNGTGIPHVDREVLEELNLYRPPGLSQRVIARILDTLDTQIEKTQTLIAKLEQVKEGLLHDLLTRGVDENGELRPSAEEAPELYKESALGLIPREWVVSRLDDVATVNRGKFTHRPRNAPRFFGGTAPFIQTGDIAAADGEHLMYASQTLSQLGISASQQFPAGTIAITIAANIADTAILGVPMFFPDSVVGAVVNHKAETQYVEMSIRAAKRGLAAKAPQSAQKNINLQDLRPLPIPLPSLREQKSIVERFLCIKRQLKTENEFSEGLRQAKSGLMDDLLTGRIRVTPLLDRASAEAT